MPNKTSGKSAAPKKETSKKSAAPKAEKKSAKAAEKLVEAAPAPEEIEIEAEAETPAVDLEELEEQEEEAAAQSSQQGGNAAAIAAASGGTTEMSASFKNFRHHPDMENFYRFIYENDLRHEALGIIDEIMVEKQQRKLGKGTKSPH
jgi:CO/xanthine dehydrogenase Mo-binding subunit